MQESEYLKDIPVVGTREEPRIAEQQFGNFQVNKEIRKDENNEGRK
jgi:hypothetical protein